MRLLDWGNRVGTTRVDAEHHPPPALCSAAGVGGGQGRDSHLPAHSVVVESHACVDVSMRLSGVQKVLGKAFSEAHIRTAATPLPGVLQAWAGGRYSRVFRDPVAQALSPLKRVQLQAVQLPTEGLFIPTPGGVATASLQFTQGTRVGHCVHYPGSCNGVGESTLSKTCGKEFGEMAQRFRAKSTNCSSKGLGSIPATHMTAHSYAARNYRNSSSSGI